MRRRSFRNSLIYEKRLISEKCRFLLAQKPAESPRFLQKDSVVDFRQASVHYEKNFAFLAKQVIIHNNEKQQKQTPC